MGGKRGLPHRDAVKTGFEWENFYKGGLVVKNEGPKKKLKKLPNQKPLEKRRRKENLETRGQARAVDHQREKRTGQTLGVADWGQ